MPDYTDTNLGSIVYNVLTTAKYTELQQGGNINSNELYLITDDSGGGGSGPSPYASNPAMDGTASPGSSADYARGDHVHPTDTSRQATLVSGTNIKTINNESLLGSGNISISGGTTEIFIATYGTTTNAEVTTALTADKTVFATRTDSGVTRYLPLTEKNAGGQYIFSMEYAGVGIYYGLDTSNNWTETTTSFFYSPAFTGTPTAPTQTAGNDSTRIATTAFVKTAGDNLKKNIVVDSNTSVASLADLKTQLTTWFSGMSNGTACFFWVYLSTSFHPFGSGDHLVRVQRATDQYGYAEFFHDFGVSTYETRYLNTNHIAMNFLSGTWHDPVSLSSMLANSFQYASRPTSANNQTTLYSGEMTQFKATDSMTTGKPSSNGHIINLNWDYTGNYAVQLFLPNANASTYSSGTRRPQIRGCNNGTWGSWENLALQSDIDSAIGTAILASY